MARWLRVVPVLLVLALVGAGLVIGFSTVEEPPAPASVAFVATAKPSKASLVGTWPAPKPSSPTSYKVADATGSTVDLFSAPDVPLVERPQMDNPTHEKLPVVFRVLEGKDAWLKVQVSMRPNEFTAWVKRDQVKIRTVPNRIVVEVAARKATVFHGDTKLMESTVAVGTTRTPTPIGTFFVDGWVPLDGRGPYGAGQISVAGFSDVLHSFGGGNGQIAIHGTNRPELLGEPVSNGCVRVENDELLKMAELAPLGTPVVIVA